MNRIIKTLLLLLASVPAFAGDRVRLAVLDLSAVNVPEFYAASVRDRIEVSLYKSSHIDLLERNKVQLVLKEHNLAKTACRDDACAVTIGKFLSATHVIVGSVSRMDSYTITIRVVDVSRGRIIYADTETAAAKEEITRASLKLTERIRTHIESVTNDQDAPNKHPFTFFLGGGYAQPMGNFMEIAGGGYSVTALGVFQDILVNGLFAGLKAGYNQFPGRGCVDSAQVAPFMVSIGFTVNITDSFFIAPVLSGGGAWNYLRRENCVNKSMVEAVANTDLLVGYRIGTSFGLHLSGDYYSIFEKDGAIQFVTIQLGIMLIL